MRKPSIEREFRRKGKSGGEAEQGKSEGERAKRRYGGGSLRKTLSGSTKAVGQKMKPWGAPWGGTSEGKEGGAREWNGKDQRVVEEPNKWGLKTNEP